MASGPYVLGMASKKWDGLSDKHKAAITDAGKAIWDRTNQYGDDHEKELAARERLVKQGITWLEDFPAADRRAYVDAVGEDLAGTGRRSRWQGARFPPTHAEGFGPIDRQT